MSESPIVENLESDSATPLERKVKVKERKPKTAGQLEQFEKVRKKRLEDISKKKEQKKIEASLLLLNNGYIKAEPKVVEEVKPSKDLDITKESSDEESEPEVVIIKKKSKKKPKPKKTIIIEESSSESEEDEPVVVSQRKMVSQQNKKSIIKVHKPQYHNYFVD